MNVLIKPGVDITGLAPEIVVGLMMTMFVYQARGHAFRLTSGRDGKHKDTSLHYKGRAVDVGVVQIEDRLEWPQLTAAVAAALGEQFDVILEQSAAGGPHIHIEWDPKPQPAKV